MARRNKQNGFITMIVVLVAIIAIAVFLVYMRVENAQK